MKNFVRSFWGGWLFLLPDLAGKRVLLVAPTSVEVIQEVNERAGFTVWLDANQISSENHGLVDQICQINQWSERPQLVTHEFDVIILFQHSGNLSLIRGFRRRLPEFLVPGGHIFTQTINPVRSGGGLKRVMHYWLWLWESYLQGSQQDELELQMFPVVFREGQISEVQTGGRYYPFQNAFLLREKIKQCLFRGVLGPLITDGVVTSRIVDRNELPLFQQVAARAAKIAGVKAWRVINYLVLNQKVVMLISFPGSSNPGVIAVMCNTDYIFQRRCRELLLLRHISEQYPEIAKRVPKPLGFEMVGPVGVCFQSKVDGMTVEIDFPGLLNVTRQATGFLTDIVSKTTNPRRIDTAEVDRFVKPLGVCAKERTPQFSAEIDRLISGLLPGLLEKNIPQVLMHGDLKIENAVYSMPDLSLAALIDWELGEIEGYPYLDIWYLLIYNRQLVGQQSFFVAFLDMLVDGHQSAEERQQLEKYDRLMSMDTGSVDCMVVLSLLFHIGNRVDYSVASALVLRELESTINKVIEWWDARHRKHVLHGA